MVSLVLLATAAMVSRQVVGEKLNLDVYYESQCPFSKNFFIEQLRPTIESLSKHVDVNMVPYGNAKTIRDGDKVTFICQHGTPECLLNKIHACSLKRIGDSLHRVLAACCLFENTSKGPSVAGETCEPKFGLNWDEVKECATGAEGTTLEDGYGNQTNSLKPSIRGVPYVVVDKHTGDGKYHASLVTHLKDKLCDALAKKKEIPEACK